MEEKTSPENVQVSLDTLLHEVHSLLDRQKIIERLVSRQEGPTQQLLQTMTERQHLSEMQRHLSSHHPADIAFVLNSLSMEDRLRLWNQIWNPHGAAVLLELSSPIRRIFLDSMGREDLIELLQHV